LDYPMRPAPNGWGQGNHQNSSGISANLHCCSGRLDRLAMLITIETAKESGQGGEGDHD
jgi:hypothetical protein